MYLGFVKVPKKSNIDFLAFIILVHMERLNLIVASCGETYVSPEELACNAGIAHTRENCFFSRYEKVYY